MEKEKNIEAQTSNENDQFTTVEECKDYIEEQKTYIKQLEDKLDTLNNKIEFLGGYSNRAHVKLTFCLQLLKLSGNDVLKAIAEKVDKTFEI